MKHYINKKVRIPTCFNLQSNLFVKYISIFTLQRTYLLYNGGAVNTIHEFAFFSSLAERIIFILQVDKNDALSIYLYDFFFACYKVIMFGALD